ncbi:MAG TPA: hypothetical protein VE959_24295, partial [Bryobacteraceae bacterium]|nr:hypothetical protein [Bryobacteraceae bacterium]
MNKFLTGLLSAFLAQAAFAADLTGRWVGGTQGPDGQTRQTVLALKQDGNKLTGYVSGMGPDSNISEGKVDGDQISFVVVRDFGGTERKMEYTGKVTGDGLVLTMPAFGGRGGAGG